MAQQGIAMGLHAIPLASNHYDKVWDPAKRRWKKMKGNITPEDPDLRDPSIMEEKGYVLRKRSEVRSDEEIVETVRHRGEVLPRRPGRPQAQRRSSSMEDVRNGDRSNGRYRRDAGGYGSESEGSVPPKSRRGRAKSASGRSGRKNRSSSSSSSSELGSTSGEERDIKKMQRKKWITAALASVATIHAASKVYSSIESHDKRIQEVQAGTMSPEEAHKKSRSARWQDAAAIGIAALGIKGAISEWNEVQEEHQHHKELLETSKEHHKRRLERQKRERAREQGGYYKGRDGNWYYCGNDPQHSEKSRRSSTADGSRQLDGPRQNERKMIEGPPERSRSIYDGGRSRARSAYGRDDSPDSRVYSRRSSPSRRRKTFSANDPDLKKYRRNDVKDFGIDAADELVNAL